MGGEWWLAGPSCPLWISQGFVLRILDFISSLFHLFLRRGFLGGSCMGGNAMWEENGGYRGLVAHCETSFGRISI